MLPIKQIKHNRSRRAHLASNKRKRDEAADRYMQKIDERLEFLAAAMPLVKRRRQTHSRDLADILVDIAEGTTNAITAMSDGNVNVHQVEHNEDVIVPDDEDDEDLQEQAAILKMDTDTATAITQAFVSAINSVDPLKDAAAAIREPQHRSTDMDCAITLDDDGNEVAVFDVDEREAALTDNQFYTNPAAYFFDASAKPTNKIEVVQETKESKTQQYKDLVANVYDTKVTTITTEASVPDIDSDDDSDSSDDDIICI